MKVKYDVSFEIMNNDETIPHTIRASGGIRVPDDVSLITLNESILDYIHTHLNSDPVEPPPVIQKKPLPEKNRSYSVLELFKNDWGPCRHCRTNNACSACRFENWFIDLESPHRYRWNGQTATSRIIQKSSDRGERLAGEPYYDFTIEPGEAIHNQATWEVNKNDI